MRTTGVFPSLAALLAACGPPAFGAFEMHEVARIPSPFHAHGRVVAADADRDGRTELYLTGHRDETIYALEHIGGFRFEPVRVCSAEVGIGFSVWSSGDADRDGLTDVLVVYNPRFTEPKHLGLIEARDSASLPSVRVWQDKPEPSGGGYYAESGLLDGDSALDVALFGVGHWKSLGIYENTGDNRFEFRTAPPPELGLGISIAIADDMDANCRPEVVTVHFEYAHVGIFEAVANDSFARVAACTLTLAPHMNGAVATPDMDRDGKPEVVASGVDGHNVCRVGVIEASAPGQFEFVWRGETGGAYFATGMCCAGDIDGDSVYEFALNTGNAVRVFKCFGNDSFAEVWSTPTSYPDHEVEILDIDRDGKAELLHNVRDSMVIFTYGPSVVTEQRHGWPEAISATPGLVRLGAPVRIAGVPDGAEVEIVDAAGRVVARPRDGVWNPRGVSPGAYFVRVRSGNQAVVHKVLVLR